LSNIQFGTGVVFVNPLTSSGNTPTNPTPFKVGILQECQIDFKGDLKKLFGQYQFPVATARGKVDVSIKGKLAVFDISFLNQIFFAQTQSTGYAVIVDGESQTVSANAATVSHTPLIADWGVQYASTGQQFIHVNSAPAQGQYSGPNLTTGVYTFNSSDNGTSVKISYTYNQNTSGATIALAGQLMGYAPEVAMFFYNKFRNKYLAVQFNDVTIGSISIPSKLEDFWISDFEGSPNLDASGNLGSLMGDLG